MPTSINCMRNISRVILLLACTQLSYANQWTKIDVTFSINSWTNFNPFEMGVPNPDFPSSVSGSFTYSFDLPQTGSFYLNNATPDSLSIFPSPFGHTVFSPANVGLDLSFTNGQFSSLILGGLVGGIDSWSSSPNPGPGAPSDFYLDIVETGGPFPVAGVFFYILDGYPNSYDSSDINTTISVTAVSESSSGSTNACALVFLLGMVAMRKRRWATLTKYAAPFARARAC